MIVGQGNTMWVKEPPAAIVVAELLKIMQMQEMLDISDMEESVRIEEPVAAAVPAFRDCGEFFFEPLFSSCQQWHI